MANKKQVVNACSFSYNRACELCCRNRCFQCQGPGFPHSGRCKSRGPDRMTLKDIDSLRVSLFLMLKYNVEIFTIWQRNLMASLKQSVLRTDISRWCGHLSGGVQHF